MYYFLRKVILCSIDNFLFWISRGCRSLFAILYSINTKKVATNLQTIKSVSLERTAIFHGSSHEAIKDFSQRYSYFSTQQPLACVVTSSIKHTELCVDFLQQLADYIDDVDLLKFTVLEFLAKIIAYRHLPQGLKITLPKEGDYLVDVCFFLQGGIPVYGLYSQENNRGILLFRGTELSLTRAGRASMKADLDWYGPGCTLYLKNRSQFRSWLKGKKVFALGHSLGGALAYYAALFDGDLLDQQQPSVAFNPPGLYKEAFGEWARRQPIPSMMTYATAGDLIPCWGRLPGSINWIQTQKKFPPMAAHTTLLFAES